MTRRVPLSALVEEREGIHSRYEMDDHLTTKLAAVLRAGYALPPMVVEAGTLRVVEGFHRRRAYREVHPEDPDVLVEVEEVEFADRKAMLAASVTSNATHGKPLTAQDHRHIVMTGLRLGFTSTALAGLLYVTNQKVETLQMEWVRPPDATFTAHGGVPGDTPGERVLPTKRATRWMETGQVLSAAQHAAFPSAPGQFYARYARDLITGLEGDLLDPANPSQRATLVALRDAIDAWLATHPAPDGLSDARN